MIGLKENRDGSITRPRRALPVPVECPAVESRGKCNMGSGVAADSDALLTDGAICHLPSVCHQMLRWITSLDYLILS